MLTIQKSKEYEDFSLIDGNRPVNLYHVQALKESMEENQELIPAIPIVVNEDLEILDGQHRFYALRELGAPIYYVVIQGASLKQIQKLNTTSKAWKMEDYANSYAKIDNENYIKFIEIKEKFPEFSYGAVIMFLQKDVKNYTSLKNFKTGLFTLRDNVEKGIEALEQLRGIGRYYESYSERNFCRAYYNILKHEEFDYDRLMEKARIAGSEFGFSKGQPLKNCMRAFEDVYNFHMKSEASKLRFYS